MMSVNVRVFFIGCSMISRDPKERKRLGREKVTGKDENYELVITNYECGLRVIASTFTSFSVNSAKQSKYLDAVLTFKIEIASSSLRDFLATTLY